MDQVSLDNCEKMHKRYEKDYMEKAGGNIRNTSCLRNHTTRTRRKKRPQIHAIFLHMEQMSGIEPPCPPWQGGVLPLNYSRKNGGSDEDRTRDLLRDREAC